MRAVIEGDPDAVAGLSAAALSAADLDAAPAWWPAFMGEQWLQAVGATTGPLTSWCETCAPDRIVVMASKAQKYPDMWVDPEDDPRGNESAGNSEREVLLDYLRHFRLTFEMKCDGLDAEQMARRSVEPSTMSLLGLLRHLAAVEQTWFRITMANEPVARLWGKDETRDADFDDAVADDAMVAEAWEAWRREVAYAEAFVDGAESLELMSTHDTRGPVSLRELLVHMIEEYARHCGHADLIRERIDGRTGQ